MAYMRCGSSSGGTVKSVDAFQVISSSLGTYHYAGCTDSISSASQSGFVADLPYVGKVVKITWTVDGYQAEALKDCIHSNCSNSTVTEHATGDKWLFGIMAETTMNLFVEK